jgi:hypothetical protein
VSDLQKIIEKINYSRSQGFITQKEAQDLKQLAQSLATKNGNLGIKDRDRINQKLNEALNKKGKEVKEDSGLKPPKTDSKPDPGKGGTKPGPGKGKPGGGDQSKEKWKKFQDGYDKLSNNQDRNVIREIFGGKPDDSKLAFFQTLSESKKDALVDAVKDGKITKDEKNKLEKLFKKTTPPGSGGGGGGNGGGDGTKPPKPIDSDNDGIPDKEDDDDDGDGIPDNIDIDDDGDGTPDENEPDPGEPNPTVKGGNKKINVPKPENRANYSIPKNSDERITMPNLDKKILREVQRLTKQLISSTKEFIEGGINYDGIDFIPDSDILTEDGQSVFEFGDFNSPGTVNSGFANERLIEITAIIQGLLDQGGRGTGKYNYAEYLDLFELRYNNDGTPYYRFSIEVVGETLEDVIVTVLEESSTGEDEGP